MDRITREAVLALLESGAVQLIEALLAEAFAAEHIPGAQRAWPAVCRAGREGDARSGGHGGRLLLGPVLQPIQGRRRSVRLTRQRGERVQRGRSVKSWVASGLCLIHRKYASKPRLPFAKIQN